MKTNKSFSKRIKVTKNGKLVIRSKGQDHYNAKESGRQGIAKRRSQHMILTHREVRRFLPASK